MAKTNENELLQSEACDPREYKKLEKFIKSQTYLVLKKDEKCLTVSHYAKLLQLEPENEAGLMWIAREFLNAPLPTDAVMTISNEGLIIFIDKKLGIHTLEHPKFEYFSQLTTYYRLQNLAANRISQLIPFRKKFSGTHIRDMPYVQVLCEVCLKTQAHKYCLVCEQATCNNCYEVLHNTESLKDHESRDMPTSTLSVDGGYPEVYDLSSGTFYSKEHFFRTHQRGNRAEHEYLQVNGIENGDGPCVFCNKEFGTLYCNSCQATYCGQCWTKFHNKGNRKNHTSHHSQIFFNCTECNCIASVWCEQCCESFCSNCFSRRHNRGAREFHLMSDLIDVDLFRILHTGYLSRALANEMEYVLNHVISLQALMRGVQTRRKFKILHQSATTVQKWWKGVLVRRAIRALLSRSTWIEAVKVIP